MIRFYINHCDTRQSDYCPTWVTIREILGFFPSMHFLLEFDPHYQNFWHTWASIEFSLSQSRTLPRVAASAGTRFHPHSPSLLHWSRTRLLATAVCSPSHTPSYTPVSWKKAREFPTPAMEHSRGSSQCTSRY